MISKRQDEISCKNISEHELNRLLNSENIYIMNTAIPPIRETQPRLKSTPNTTPNNTTIPETTKTETLTCEQRDEVISRLRNRPNDGGVNSWGRLAGNLLYILDIPRNCPNP